MSRALRAADRNVASLLAIAPDPPPAPPAVVAALRSAFLSAQVSTCGDDALDALVARAGAGDAAARAELFDLLYDNLKMLAFASMRRQRRQLTLQATALVSEAYLRLSRRTSGWQSRSHFLASAARAMRWILVDHVRSRSRLCRTATGHRQTLQDAVRELQRRSIDIVQLDIALRELEAVDPEAARVVELRFFGKLKLPGVAKLLGISLRTAERKWTFARVWLRAALGNGDEGPAADV